LLHRKKNENKTAEFNAVANDNKRGSTVLKPTQQGERRNISSRGILAVAFHCQISEDFAVEHKHFCIHFNAQVKSNRAKASGRDPTKSPSQS